MEQQLIDNFERALKFEFEVKKKALDSEYNDRLNAFRFATGRAPLIILSVPESKTLGNGAALKINEPRFAGGGEVVPLAEEKPSMMKATRAAIKQIDTEFSIRDVLNVVQRLFPKLDADATDLSNPLWSLSSGGEIELVRRGHGREPNIYRKK